MLDKCECSRLCSRLCNSFGSRLPSLFHSSLCSPLRSRLSTALRGRLGSLRRSRLRYRVRVAGDRPSSPASVSRFRCLSAAAGLSCQRQRSIEQLARARRRPSHHGLGSSRRTADLDQPSASSAPGQAAGGRRQADFGGDHPSGDAGPARYRTRSWSGGGAAFDSKVQATRARARALEARARSGPTRPYLGGRPYRLACRLLLLTSFPATCRRADGPGAGEVCAPPRDGRGDASGRCEPGRPAAHRPHFSMDENKLPIRCSN